MAFGPRWHDSRDAALLLQPGAAVALPPAMGRAARALETASGRTGSDDEARPAGQGQRGAGSRRARLRRVSAERGDAGRAYFVTTPSKVTVRGTIRPPVSAVMRMSVKRLRTLIFRSAIPLPPAS